MIDDKEWVVNLKIGGKYFLLTSHSIKAMDSDFLNRLLDPESGFKKPDDNVYEIDADAECFSSFFHHSQYGDLVSSKLKEGKMLEQADFWGIHQRIKNEFNKIHQMKQEAQYLINVILTEQSALVESRKHHNQRHDDGSRRVYCSSCGHRDIDSRFSKGDDYYVKCKVCSKRMTYDPDLGWCHKCSHCSNCQLSSCPNDYKNDDKNYGHWSAAHRNTKDYEKKLAELNKSLDNIFI